MAFYDVFEQLCNQRNITPTQVARDNGLTQQTVSHWKTRGSTPKAETVQKLADYFGVSVDYLLGLRPLPDDIAKVFLGRDIGLNLKDLRKAKGLTQKELSEKTGIPLTDIQLFERGAGKYFPTEDELLRLSEVFGIVPEHIKGTRVTQKWILEAMERNKKLQDSSPPVKNIIFNATPDPEWAELEKKMEDGTITQAEAQRYSDLMEQGYASLRKSIPELKARLQRMVEQLNDAGQQKLEDYAQDLARIPEYRREQPTAPTQSPLAPQEGKDTTPPSDAPETPPEGE